jgi:hypothetical protein
MDLNGEARLYVSAGGVEQLRSAFRAAERPLLAEAGIKKEPVDGLWFIDNGSQDPQNRTTGYMTFLVKEDGDEVAVYGASVRITRLGDNNQQEFDNESCGVTQLSVDMMSDTTTLPNGSFLSSNQKNDRTTWDDRWMRAPTLPSPPTCVPTFGKFCGPASQPKR